MTVLERFIAPLALSVVFATAVVAQTAPPFVKSAIDIARDRNIAVKFNRVTYTTKFDLSGLPDYKPQTKVSGVIRMRGANYFTDSPLAQWWAEEFKKWHPEVSFDFQLRSSQHAISSLIYGVTDISPLGRAITNAERLAFQREFNYQPLGVIAVTGSRRDRRPDWCSSFIRIIRFPN